MKHTKKFLSLALAGVMAASLAACGDGAQTKQDGKDAGSGAPSGKKYIIAMDTTFSPFEFEDVKGNRVGIDVDLLQAIAEDQGFEYETQAIGFTPALQAVEANQADAIMAGCSITEERKQKVDFSEPYFDSEVCLAVKQGNDEIKSYDDLKGKKVAAKSGTEGLAFAESIQNQYGFEITIFKDSAFMYEDVKTGNTVGCFEDYPVMAYGIQQGNGLQLTDMRERGSSYGLGVKKGQNGELIEMFNKGLQNIRDNGKYQEIVDKYTK